MISYESLVLEDVWDWWIYPIESLKDADSKRTYLFVLFIFVLFINNQKKKCCIHTGLSWILAETSSEKYLPIQIEGKKYGLLCTDWTNDYSWFHNWINYILVPN